MRNFRCRIALVLAGAFLSATLTTGHAQVTRPNISPTVSPIHDVTVTARDGHDVIAVVREPPGDGPFPAVIAVHGGLWTMTREELRNEALDNPTMTRLLANGYVTVIPTFRRRDEDPQTLTALWDNLAIVDYVKQMESVDPSSVSIYGCSGGGDLVLEIAGETTVAAVTSEEPATVVFTGMFDTGTPRQGETYEGTDAFVLLEDPFAYYTPELQAFTQGKIRKIDAPVFFVQGDQLLGRDPSVDHLRIQNEILLREMDAADKEWTRTVYPGQFHCFGFEGVSPMARDFFDDMDSFFKLHSPTQPVPIDASHVDYVQVEVPQ